MAKKSIFDEQITVDGELYDFHVSSNCIVIREATGNPGEKRGWKHFKKFKLSEHLEAKAEWEAMYDRRYVTAVAKVEKSKLDTMSNLQPIAAQINEKYARFEVVEKEATMLMLEIGLAVEFAKEQLPHGQLMKWTQDNLTITHRHANRFRQLAQVFIKANNLKEDEAFLLCDPENSKEALGDKLRQMAFDFLGDRTQAELFEQYKIKSSEAANQKQRSLPKPKPLDPGESQAHRDATELIYPLMDHLQEYIIGDRRVVQHLDLKELKTLEADLVDALNNVRQLIKAG